MKKLFFTVAIVLLTTLSFATNEKASENVKPVKLIKVKLEVECADGFVWYYSGTLDPTNIEAMLADMASGC